LGPELVKRRPEITMEMVDKFLTRMYRTNPTSSSPSTRDFVRQCQTPVLILPDDIPRIRTPSPWRPRCSRQGRSEHVPVEGAQGTDSSGGAPDTFLPPGASTVDWQRRGENKQ
jgi:hypothetical protein